MGLTDPTRISTEEAYQVYMFSNFTGISIKTQHRFRTPNVTYPHYQLMLNNINYK